MDAGGNRARSRRYEMGEVSGRLADLSVVTADNSRFEDVMDIISDIEVGLHKTDGKYIVIPDRKEAIKYCMDTRRRGTLLSSLARDMKIIRRSKGSNTIWTNGKSLRTF